MKTAKSSKKTVSKSEDVLIKVCGVIFADEHAWPGSQKSLTSAFVFLLLTFPSIHGPLFDTIMFGQLVRLVANLSVHPRVGPAIACDEASILQILKILGK